MKRNKPTLADVDGTTTGKAALVMINLDDEYGETGHQSLMRADFDDLFLDGKPGPIKQCWALWEATKEDWPHHHATVVANHRAEYLEWIDRQRALLGEDTDVSPEFYVSLFEKE